MEILLDRIAIIADQIEVYLIGNESVNNEIVKHLELALVELGKAYDIADRGRMH
jgi:hypothetical protein